MIEIIISFVIALVSFWAGWKYREYTLKKIIRGCRTVLEQSLDHAKSYIVIVTIVKDGEYYLVYNKETKEFLAQGKSHKEISDILSNRFPDKAFVADRDNVDGIGYDYDSF